MRSRVFSIFSGPSTAPGAGEPRAGTTGDAVAAGQARQRAGFHAESRGAVTSVF